MRLFRRHHLAHNRRSATAAIAAIAATRMPTQARSGDERSLSFVPLVDMVFRQPDHFSVWRRICSISGNPHAYMQDFWHTIAVLPLPPFMPFVPICPSDTDDTDDISDNWSSLAISYSQDSHILILIILIRFLIAAA
ncbi:MAG: hypothetical protein JNM70_19840 [Anaerolineae bacterium]|nr:hypothetical protein [Anaerolineae bacterium]